jgi:hypothetical protein
MGHRTHLGLARTQPVHHDMLGWGLDAEVEGQRTGLGRPQGRGLGWKLLRGKRRTRRARSKHCRCHHRSLHGLLHG